MQQHCYDFPKNLTYALVGIEPRSAVREADAMLSGPRRQINFYNFNSVLGVKFGSQG
jgi:hypothetical protein